MYVKVKRRVYEIVEITKPGDKASSAFNIFIITLILLNVIALMLASVESIFSRIPGILRLFGLFSIVVFTVEYILRIWVCNLNENFKGKFIGKLRYAITPLALVDLFAILPFYIPLLIPIDLRFIRVIRLIRIFRIFKIGRYIESIRVIGNVLRKKRGELFITVFVVIILLIVSASLMYEVERNIQPEVFGSIPQSMWWAVITLTTVGYGDAYPVTALGKFLSSIISLLGIGLIALPTGIISSGMVSEIKQKNKKMIKCPKCGEIIKE
ncbi:hypothetical protein ES703_23485 [subsurface metagenome]